MALKQLVLAGLATLAAADQKPLFSDVQKKPLVSSDALQAAIRGENLLARARQLFDAARLGEDEYRHPTRVIGSRGHAGTLRYIEESLRRLGSYYNLQAQPFPAVSGRVVESRLELDHHRPASASPMSLTPSTPARQPVDARLVLVANQGCRAADFPPAVAGNIALIRRGSCPFGAKSELAGRAGAAAAVVFNTDESPLTGTLGAPSPRHVATFGLSGAEAQPYLARLGEGHHVRATAYMDAVVETVVTTNIIAQTAEGDGDNCVMLGGHSDSVAEGPGINDDGSGSLALLEIATQLASFRVANCVRFAWWAGEEEGLLGSDYYVDVLPADENKKIRLFMDYDMLASPNFAYQIYDARNDAHPAGSQELRDLYVDWYVGRGLNYTLIPFDSRSDYDGFIRHGIPAGGIATGAEGIKTDSEAAMFGGQSGAPYDACYHELCDDLSNLDLGAWELNTKLIAHSVATFARSFDGFPERTGEWEAAAAQRTKYERSVKYRGSKLFI